MKPQADDPRWQADALADATVESFLGQRLADSAGADDRAEGFRRLAAAQRAIGQWGDNASLAGWTPDAGCPPEVGQALRHYLDEASVLPSWADAALIGRAENLFMRHGPLSCLLLFCASLPECYVMPDLSAVLHASGQLEAHTEHRIRQTAAMVFPVMLRGGLTAPGGSGIAQVLKVRLIHATIRHLVLRSSPQQAIADGRPRAALAPAGGEAAMQDPVAALHHQLHRMGWPLGERGLPCNQQELGYTLLTFHYVFLRGLHTLRLPLEADDERAYLHAWNVAGHVLGLTGLGMAATLPEARATFESLRDQGARQPAAPDPRPELAQALMGTMQAELPWRWLWPLPVLMTNRLCGPVTARALALDGPQPWPGRLAFALGWGLVDLIDTIARWVWPRFSLSGLVTRVLGYRLTAKLLMDQTRPLRLPVALQPQIDATLAHWRRRPGLADPSAPAGYGTWLLQRLTSSPSRGR